MKGINPKAREIAKDLARRSGMTLGEWLNQVILEDGPAEEPPHYSAAGRAPSGPSPPPSYRRFETPEHPGDEVFRVAEALDRLSARIEAAEHRATLAIGGIDQSVSGLVTRLEGSEREQTAVAARFEGVADDLRTDHTRLVERLRRIEVDAAGPRSVEAVRSMEAALAKVAGHLYEGEARTNETLGGLRDDLNSVSARLAGAPTSETAAQLVEGVVARITDRLDQAEARTGTALRALQDSSVQLDDRLNAAEARLEGRQTEAGLEQLAASLSARVDAARAEMAEKIRATADGRFDRMERTLQEMNGHVQAAERRSAQAIERMGHEVLRMADTLARKVQDVEHHSADAIEQVGGEVARIAEVVENRLGRADSAGAQALEKLGGEIARITERLAERIANAERRSAQAIDDVGEQVTRVSDRLQDRQERASNDLAERIRQSEERTAKLLEDARERIDQRLGETQRKLEEAAAPPPSPVYPIYADPAVAPFGQNSFESVRRSYVEPDVAPFGEDRAVEPVAEREQFSMSPMDGDDYDAPAEALLEPEPLAGDRFDDPEAPALGADLLDEEALAAADLLDEPYVDLELEPAADDELTPPDELVGPDEFGGRHADAPELEELAAETEDEPSQTLGPPRNLTARELVEQARASARASQGPDGKPAKLRPGGDEAGSMFTGFGFGRIKSKRRSGSPLQTALLVSGGTAALGIALAGYVILWGKPGGVVPGRVAEASRQQLARPGGPLTSELGEPLAATALSPKPLAAADQTAAVPPASAAAQVTGADLYVDGARKVDAHDFSGVDALRKSANLGYGPAEFYLAKLYETGAAGIKKDLGEARRWTERAAETGDPKAMHNLALYYFEGSGGPKNLTTAAGWFRRAADLGLVDSQYNLGRLYEMGLGVSQNPAEAYKWYLIAAHAGDSESRVSALQLKGQLSTEAQAAAERAAQSYQAHAGQLAQAGGTGDGGVAVAQRALSRLGYYQGPADGASSPALKLAIAAYQRDQGLPATGALDPVVGQKLGAIAQ